MGLMTPDKATLPITVTFVTERFIETGKRRICCHLCTCTKFSITLVNLKRGTLPKVFRKDYNINDDVYKQSYKRKDVKSYFDHIACKYGYQGNLKTSLSRISATTSADSEEKKNSVEIYHAQFEAKYLGNENILGLDVNAEICHKMLEKMEVYIDAAQSLQDVLLDISPSGIDIQDKSFKNVLHHHSFNKISYITQDFANPHVFGYVFETIIRVINSLDSRQFKEKVKLVEDIFWWLEGCSGNITPTSFESEDIALNVKLHDLYIAAVTKKLIEKEHEEEVKKTKVEEKPVISAKLPLSSSEKVVIELLKKHSTYFQSALKNKKQRNKLLMKKILKLNNEDIVSDKDKMLQEESTFLEKFCSETFEEMRTESSDLKQKIESINQTEISEREKLPVKVSNAINICKHYFSNALKIRKEEVNDLNYIISALHFRENRLPSEETRAIILSRKLLVIAANRRLREIKDIELNLTQLNKAEDFIIFAVRQLKRLKRIFGELKNIEEKGIHEFEEILLKFQDREHYIENNVFSLCYKFFREAIRNRKKEFDVLVNNLDLLEATEIDDADNEGIEFVNDCKDTFLSSIIFREKEIEILEKEFKKVSDFSRMPILPVIYTFKDMFDSISLNLKKKHIEESDDPTSAKTLQIYTSLEEFLTMAFELKKKEIEIPLEVLKQDLENVISSMIEEVRKREMERISEFRRRIQALQILNSWKEVFLEAASLRKSEIMEVVPVKLKETKEEEAVIKSLLQDERHNIDAEGRKIADAYRKIFSHVNDMKKYEVEQIKKLLRKPDVTTSEENTEQEDHTSTHADVAEIEYFEEDSEEDEEGPQAEMLLAQETAKRYMLEELDKEKNGLAFIMDNIEQLDKVFSGLIIKPTHDLRSFYRSCGRCVEFRRNKST
ncbi:hexokinase [Caerostris extrusa]|uniref:Hexokinase n=1 Tax=Caerostris extrusa TaxID=172846 RepID=A0AAV4RTT2_CAEEX|nr:hexokinase [Caerostris extrusa]